MSSDNYKINEELLRQRFSEYEVSFDDKSWNDLEKDLDQVKTQNSISFGKVNPKLLLIPVCVIALAAALYLNIDKLTGKNADSAASLPVQTRANENKTAVPEVKQEAKITPPVAEKPKADSIVKDPGPITIAKQAEPVPVKKEEAIVKNDVVKKEEKSPPVTVDTNSNAKPPVVSESQAKKKKKKKRRNGSYDAIETIRTTSLIPSSQDDDVVVPVN